MGFHFIFISALSVRVVNLDPAAEYFDYDVAADIRELISLEDAMDDDDLKFGPNGGLVFCMEYFAQVCFIFFYLLMSKRCVIKGSTCLPFPY